MSTSIQTPPVARAVRQPGTDLAALLHPSAGLVRAHGIEPPSGSNARMWRMTARLACGHADDAGDDLLLTCVTGACSPTRAEVMVRTLGEAVERLALHPAPGLVARPGDLPGPRVDHRAPGAELGAETGDEPLTWHRARHLASGADVWVPAGLVSYPAPAETPRFDPGPSGAAAHLDRDRALRGALLETVERDALITAWACRLQLRAVPVDELVRRVPDDPGWRRVADLLDRVRGAGLDPVLAEVPHSVPGVHCVVGGVRFETAEGPGLCLGTKTTPVPALAVAGALEESLQLLPALTDLRARPGRPVPEPVTGENDRLAFLATPWGVDALEEWLADPAPATMPLEATDLDTADLVALTRADGLDPVLLDLTDRLPAAVRRHGWTVVKVVPVGYQPLRIDERTAYGWNHHRLASAPRRTGARSRLSGAPPSSLPHPLP
jgi:ribosomal protein S12 methylthiotransferase accessory factor